MAKRKNQGRKERKTNKPANEEPVKISPAEIAPDEDNEPINMLGLPVADLEPDEDEAYDYPTEDNEAVLERATAAVSGKTKRKRKRSVQVNKGKLDSDYVANMLANPTKFVSEEELQQEYGHVVADIRSMFLLASALVVVLIGLAQLL